MSNSDNVIETSKFTHRNVQNCSSFSTLVTLKIYICRVTSAKSFEVIYLIPLIKLWGMNPISLSASWEDSLDIIDLNPVKILKGIHPMVLSAPWDESLEIVVFQEVK